MLAANLRNTPLLQPFLQLADVLVTDGPRQLASLSTCATRSGRQFLKKHGCLLHLVKADRIDKLLRESECDENVG